MSVLPALELAAAELPLGQELPSEPESRSELELPLVQALESEPELPSELESVVVVAAVAELSAELVRAAEDSYFLRYRLGQPLP